MACRAASREANCIAVQAARGSCLTMPLRLYTDCANFGQKSILETLEIKTKVTGVLPSVVSIEK